MDSGRRDVELEDTEIRRDKISVGGRHSEGSSGEAGTEGGENERMK